MKKVVTALGTGLLACGLFAGMGLTSVAANAGADTTPVLSATVPQADNYTGADETATEGAAFPARSTLTNVLAGYPASTGLSTPTFTITVSIANTVSGDIYEAGVCNPDASNPSPLLAAPGPCNGPFFADGNGGTITIPVTFKPGPQNLNGKDGNPAPPYQIATTKDGCPTSGHQVAIGDSCIVSAADVSEVGTSSLWTGFVGMLFDAKQKTEPTAGTPNGALTVLWSGSAQEAKVYVTTGLGVEGVNLTTSPPSAGGCQPYSGATGTSWTAEPLCGQNLAEGEGYAVSLGEPALLGGTVVADGQANSETSGGSTFVAVPKASGFETTISCATLAAVGYPLGSAAQDIPVFAQGLGAGPTDGYAGASEATFVGLLKLPKAPKGYTGCPSTSS